MYNSLTKSLASSSMVYYSTFLVEILAIQGKTCHSSREIEIEELGSFIVHPNRGVSCVLAYGTLETNFCSFRIPFFDTSCSFEYMSKKKKSIEYHGHDDTPGHMIRFIRIEFVLNLVGDHPTIGPRSMPTILPNKKLTIGYHQFF